MNKKLLFVLIPTSVLLICCICALCVLNMPSGYELYTQQIQQAEKYLADNDYDSAIKSYRAAIDAEPYKEDAYIKLAEIYYNNKNDIDLAIAILNEGASKIKSDAIQRAIAIYTAAQNGTEPYSKAPSTDAVNVTSLTMFGQYNYEQYKNNYSVVSENFESGAYIAEYSGLNAQIIFRNSSDNTVIDSSTLKPFNYAFPTEIKPKSVSDIINIPQNGLTEEELRKVAGVSSIKSEYDNTLKKNVISFSCGKCTVKVESDENGTIKPDTSYISINPETTVTENKKAVVSGKIISVTTAANVNNSVIIVRKGTDVKSGDSVFEMTTEDGNYSIELETGDYTFEVGADGYTKEYFNVYVSGAPLKNDFSISPSLGADEIRIVLEWGETPGDLDSHLEGRTGSGTEVNLYYANSEVISNGKTIATLDVDDMNGFGPETVTLSDTTGNYTYRVHRFSNYGTLGASGATVKVYAGSSQPTTISVPSVADEWWDVFTIENGQIKNINGAAN